MLYILVCGTQLMVRNRTPTKQDRNPPNNTEWKELKTAERPDAGKQSTWRRSGKESRGQTVLALQPGCDRILGRRQLERKQLLKVTFPEAIQSSRGSLSGALCWALGK